MTFVESSLGLTPNVSLGEKLGILPQPQVLPTLNSVLQMQENSIDEINLKLSLLQKHVKLQKANLQLQREKLQELLEQEVRPLTHEELEKMRRDSRELLAT